MVAASRATCIGEDEDLLAVLHERLRFSEVGMRRPVLDCEPVAICIDLADDPARTAGHLGHHICPEPLHDLVECALYRFHRCQLLDQPVTSFERLAALHDIAILVIGWPRREIAVAVSEALVKLGREAVEEVIQNIFAWRDIDLNVVPLARIDVGEAARQQRFPRRDDLQSRRSALASSSP